MKTRNTLHRREKDQYKRKIRGSKIQKSEDKKGY
jgi:hypothetical protein